ncbi:hypothetical protein ILUMI_22955 [Ignelater luminosus]|uniref:Uncharacterized protein n=1 Tax=Ignelater luminosus TaxID=2038154 RepID=A0A8K0G2D6_IGNLU|nr:hypothetical protein ILUMI_22955 [Ignelater luminosus]
MSERRYNKAAMKAAIAKVQRHGDKLRPRATKCGVPKSTLLFKLQNPCYKQTFDPHKLNLPVEQISECLEQINDGRIDDKDEREMYTKKKQIKLASNKIDEKEAAANRPTLVQFLKLLRVIETSRKTLGQQFEKNYF